MAGVQSLPREPSHQGRLCSALARFPNHLDLFAVRGDGRVYTSIEFNRVRETYPMVIEQIIARVMPEYITYSAWASSGGGDVNNPNVGGQLDHDLIQLASRFPGNKPQLIIGELGPANFTGEDPDTPRGRNEAWQLAQNARAVQRAQSPANILWAAYDNAIDPNSPSQGVLSADGRNGM
jgi:hypothetical protein